MKPKFRAWIPSLKKMVIVDILDLAFGMIEQHEDGIFNWSGNKPLYVKKGKKPFKKCILMQYFDLKDKQKKEIYHKDIVKFVLPKAFKDTHNDTHIVSFPEDFLWLQTQGKQVEIIGNIYENPELLKEENQ